MNDIATRAIPSDDRWMPGARHAKSGYLPPKASARIFLSQALAGTDRFPKAPQLDFLGSRREDRDDIPLFTAGDISLLKRPCVAIVGTRQVSDAGIVRTARLTR
jgi:DNA processing protein